MLTIFMCFVTTCSSSSVPSLFLSPARFLIGLVCLFFMTEFCESFVYPFGAMCFVNISSLPVACLFILFMWTFTKKSFHFEEVQFIHFFLLCGVCVCV